MVIKTDRPHGSGSNPKKRILDLPALIKHNLEHSILRFTPICKMSDIEAKPKRVLTEEQKAKMKAGREAAKAKREAEKAASEPETASTTSSKTKRVITEEQKAKMKAGREAAKAKREADKAAGIETPKKEKKAVSESESGSTTSSKTKRVITDEQKAKMKAGREAAKAKRDADKAAGIETPKKERKSKSPGAPRKVLTQKVWEALLDEVRRDLKPEFEDYIQSKLA